MYPYCRMPRHITALYLYSVLNCIALLHLTLVDADVIVVKEGSNGSTEVYSDIPASFGAMLPDNGLKGYVIPAKPINGCSPIEPPPNITNQYGHWIAMIRRYDCTFAEKVRAAQQAGYHAAIIRNVNSNNLDPMAGSKDDDIMIPSVFVGEADGLEIESKFTYDKGYLVVLWPNLPWYTTLECYLLAYGFFLIGMFAMLIIRMLIKCIKDHRRMSRYRLPRSSLRKIPVKKFKKGDPYDLCAICLEEYVEGEKMRLLPCGHAYHCKCVDPWLTKTRRVCPVCKRKILYNGEHFSDSEPDSDNEQAPLLQPGNYGTQGGTFSAGRIPVAVTTDEIHSQQQEEVETRPENQSMTTAAEVIGTTNDGYVSDCDENETANQVVLTRTSDVQFDTHDENVVV